jgi:threonine dehydratase
MRLVTLDEIRAARRRIAGGAVRTPLLPCPWADDGRPLWLKPESLQPTGAFKIRGATNAVSRLAAAGSAAGVVTDSSGNHAQAVAYAARRYRLPAVIVMPDVAPDVKVVATRALGAEVILVPPADRKTASAAVADGRGYAYIPPYDHPDVIAGQGTAGLEIADDMVELGLDLDTVLVPVSGGGLISGIATAIKTLRPQVKVIGVEPELAADAQESLRRGELVAWEPARTYRTVADGLRMTLSPLTWAHVSAYVDDIVTVSEDEILEAVRVLATRARLVAEPSGAVTTAAYLFHPDALPAGRHHVAMVSGGNVDPGLLARVLTA